MAFWWIDENEERNYFSLTMTDVGMLEIFFSCYHLRESCLICNWSSKRQVHHYLVKCKPYFIFFVYMYNFTYSFYPYYLNDYKKYADSKFDNIFLSSFYSFSDIFEENTKLFSNAFLLLPLGNFLFYQGLLQRATNAFQCDYTLRFCLHES